MHWNSCSSQRPDQEMGMEVATIISANLTCEYRTERDGLQTASWPVLLVPPCAACGRAALAPVCGTCRIAFCEACVKAHACCCQSCGAMCQADDRPCARCGMLLCYTCAWLGVCGCQSESGLASGDSGEPEREEEPVSEIHDANNSQLQTRATWGFLNELWAPRGTPMARANSDMWVGVVAVSGLCRKWLRPNGACRPFGQEVHDFALLAAALEWEFPNGIAVMNLDTASCVVCVPGRPAHAADVDSAISWLRSTRGQAFGVALKTIGAKLQGAFVDVQYTPRCNAKETAAKRQRILVAVAAVVD